MFSEGYLEVCALAEAKAAASGGVEEVQLSLMQKGKALVGALQPAYWQALIVVSLLYFARFDASFITLRARTVRHPSILLHQALKLLRLPHRLCCSLAVWFAHCW